MISIPWKPADGALRDGWTLALPDDLIIAVFLSEASERWTVRLQGRETLQVWRRGHPYGRTEARTWAERWIRENYPLWVLSLEGKELLTKLGEKRT